MFSRGDSVNKAKTHCMGTVLLTTTINRLVESGSCDHLNRMGQCPGSNPHHLSKGRRKIPCTWEMKFGFNWYNPLNESVVVRRFSLFCLFLSGCFFAGL